VLAALVVRSTHVRDVPYDTKDDCAPRLLSLR
jgi:hypothetical protein